MKREFVRKQTSTLALIGVLFVFFQIIYLNYLALGIDLTDESFYISEMRNPGGPSLPLIAFFKLFAWTNSFTYQILFIRILRIFLYVLSITVLSFGVNRLVKAGFLV